MALQVDPGSAAHRPQLGPDAGSPRGPTEGRGNLRSVHATPSDILESRLRLLSFVPSGTTTAVAEVSQRRGVAPRRLELELAPDCPRIGSSSRRPRIDRTSTSTRPRRGQASRPCGRERPSSKRAASAVCDTAGHLRRSRLWEKGRQRPLQVPWRGAGRPGMLALGCSFPQRVAGRAAACRIASPPSRAASRPLAQHRSAPRRPFRGHSSGSSADEDDDR